MRLISLLAARFRLLLARCCFRAGRFFADLGDQRPDEGFRRITEIFHLD